MNSFLVLSSVICGNSLSPGQGSADMLTLVVALSLFTSKKTHCRYEPSSETHGSSLLYHYARNEHNK